VIVNLFVDHTDRAAREIFKLVSAFVNQKKMVDFENQQSLFGLKLKPLHAKCVSNFFKILGSRQSNEPRLCNFPEYQEYYKKLDINRISFFTGVLPMVEEIIYHFDKGNNELLLKPDTELCFIFDIATSIITNYYKRAESGMNPVLLIVMAILQRAKDAEKFL
jgi:hypothetical protein